MYKNAMHTCCQTWSHNSVKQCLPTSVKFTCELVTCNNILHSLSSTVKMVTSLFYIQSGQLKVPANKNSILSKSTAARTTCHIYIFDKMQTLLYKLNFLHSRPEMKDTSWWNQNKKRIMKYTNSTIKNLEFLYSEKSPHL